MAKELCPECGNLVASIDAMTGWCRKCTLEYDVNSTTCRDCGKPKLGEHCDYCRIEIFLRLNGDHIEHHMTKGCSFSVAISKLRIDVKPSCVVCGAVIKRARRDAVFCSRNVNCRTASRRYTYLYQIKKLTKPEALAKILEEIDG
jgi:predicted amidophosphoribosyltransferase